MTIQELARKVMQTKSPEDYKAFSDACDELSDEELSMAAGGDMQADLRVRRHISADFADGNGGLA